MPAERSWSKVIATVHTFVWKLSWRRRALLLAALLVLPGASLLLHTLSFSRLAGWLGARLAETPLHATATQEALACDIGWAVSAIARRLPWKPKCLAQALATTFLSRCCRLPTTLYLGVARKPEENLRAHAWVRCGANVVVGRNGHREFTVVGSFARASRVAAVRDC